MKVKIGKYSSWFGPYQLAKKICFWAKEEEDEHGFKHSPSWVHNFGEWLAHGSIKEDDDVFGLSSDDRKVTLLFKFLSWIESKKNRKIEVHIDRWDTWSMDHTLALITLPMLKQLQATKHGSPMVDDKDIPKSLGIRSTDAPPVEDVGDVDDNLHKRWDWIMSEMIWAFEQIVDDDNDSQFHSGEHDLFFEKLDDGSGHSVMKTGPKDTHVFDKKAFTKHHQRIDNGLALFGKYYRGLWD